MLNRGPPRHLKNPATATQRSITNPHIASGLRVWGGVHLLFFLLPSWRQCLGYCAFASYSQCVAFTFQKVASQRCMCRDMLQSSELRVVARIGRVCQFRKSSIYTLPQLHSVLHRLYT
eukprot:268103-Amphidinium_carterae.1